MMGLLPHRAQCPRGQRRGFGQDLKPQDLLPGAGVRWAAVFQDPYQSLNPVLSVGEQIWEGPLTHGKISRAERIDFAVEQMRAVGIDHAEKRWKDLPHQFSGGMCQRIHLASALACSPEVLFLDEPTSNLDSTSEKPLLELLQRILDERQMACVLVTHHVPMAFTFCDRIQVMHRGCVLETATPLVLFDRARHPYTRMLLRAAGSTQYPRTDWFEDEEGSFQTPNVVDRPVLPPLMEIDEGHTFRDLWANEHALAESEASRGQS
jgi:peptide/nickel transport system ATP-binding protein